MTNVDTILAVLINKPTVEEAGRFLASLGTLDLRDIAGFVAVVDQETAEAIFEAASEAANWTSFWWKLERLEAILAAVCARD